MPLKYLRVDIRHRLARRLETFSDVSSSSLQPLLVSPAPLPFLSPFFSALVCLGALVQP